MNKKDQEIIDCILSGSNQKALNYLYKDPLKKVRGYILKNSGTIDDANDVFHDALLVLFHYVKTNKYNPKYELDAFLFGVARNAWIDKVRKNKKLNTSVEVEKIEHQIEHNALGEIIQAEKLTIFKNIFDKLEENCRQLLQLVLFEKKSMKEIKDIMGLKHENVAKSQHYRCKQYFSKLLHEDKNALSALRP